MFHTLTKSKVMYHHVLGHILLLYIHQQKQQTIANKLLTQTRSFYVISVSEQSKVTLKF